MYTNRRNIEGRRIVDGIPGEANRAWIALEERTKRRLAFFPLVAREGKDLDEGMIEDFTIDRTIRDILGIEELVAGGLFVDSVENFVHAFLIVFVLDKMLLD